MTVALIVPSGIYCPPQELPSAGPTVRDRQYR
jgi:hypothetical protein